MSVTLFVGRSPREPPSSSINDYTRPNPLLPVRRGGSAGPEGHLGRPSGARKDRIRAAKRRRSANGSRVACAAAAEYCAEDGRASSVVWSCAVYVGCTTCSASGVPGTVCRRGFERSRTTWTIMADQTRYCRLLLANLGVVEGPSREASGVQRLNWRAGRKQVWRAAPANGNVPARTARKVLTSGTLSTALRCPMTSGQAPRADPERVLII